MWYRIPQAGRGRSCPCAPTASIGASRDKKGTCNAPDQGAEARRCGEKTVWRATREEGRACRHVPKMCQATLSTHARDWPSPGGDLSMFLHSRDHQQELRVQSQVPQNQLERIQRVLSSEIILVMFNRLSPWAPLFVWQI